MMKEQKSLGNKGFSLVELIVVIAIMAILVAVLAPTLISKIEDSREGTDYSTLGEIKTAIEEAIVGNEDVYNEVVGSGETVIYVYPSGNVNSTDTDATDDDLKNLQSEFTTVIGKFSFKSKEAKNGGYVKVTVSSTGKVTAQIFNNGAPISTVETVG